MTAIVFFDTASHYNTKQTQPNVRVYKKGQIIVELCSGAPWVRIFGYLCIQEIVVLRKLSVRTSTASCKLGWNFAFQVPVRFGGKSLSHPDF